VETSFEAKREIDKDGEKDEVEREMSEKDKVLTGAANRMTILV
jgi:hypothetical protein